jgi:hypothetical protein
MAKERKQSRVAMNIVGGGNRNSNDQEDPENVYCRFGTLTLRGEIMSGSDVICYPLPTEKSVVKVSISFDNITWSSEPMENWTYSCKLIEYDRILKRE